MNPYEKAGVNQDKADEILGSFGQYLAKRPKDPNILQGIGPYASCYSLASTLKGMNDPIMVSSCDGVGTKVKLALDWNRLHHLGDDLVAMNVNDILCVGAKPLIFLDYYACGSLDKTQLLTLLESIQHACEKAGCSLVGGETAEMPGMYQGKDFDLGGFAVGVVDKKDIIGPHRVKIGDQVVAIESTGIHSNGYSLVRKLVESEKLLADGKTPFGGTWGSVLLAPTRIYTPYLAPLLSKVSALAHITGGGLFGNLPRVLNPGTQAVIREKDWELPPLFEWLKKTAQMTTEELLQSFNGGVGMIAVLPSENVAHFKKELDQKGLRAWTVGEIAPLASTEPIVTWQ